MKKIKAHLRDFIPKSYLCLREGYNLKLFFSDLFSGTCIGIIAIPLALAFAIASGVAPERGLYTAIIAGFLISLLGGSRVQIGGPTGAYVVLVYSIVANYGYAGLALATLIAGFLLIAMGLARFGILLRFIPYPVTIGFTSGIAVVILFGQVKDFLGLKIASLPPDFLGKCSLYWQNLHTASFLASIIACATLVSILLLKKLSPRLPGAMLAIGCATLFTSLFQIPVDTIGSKFGEIPRTLPAPGLPAFSWDLLFKLFPSALSVALLGALESLLSAAVADGLTGHKHRSNCELAAQGMANIASSLFGGIPATGALARTSANIKLGGKTPIAGMIHALIILLLTLFFAPYVAKIPLAALAGVLVFVAWNMCELPHFIEILRSQKGDAIALLITFGLTIFTDLTVAIQVGVLLSALIFLKRMSDKTSVQICKALADENNPTLKGETESSLFQEKLLPEIALFEINGPFFYAVSHLLDEALIQLEVSPKIFILNMHKTSLVDTTALKALKQFQQKCQQKNILFLVAADNNRLFKKSTLENLCGPERLFHNVASALFYAKKTLAKNDFAPVLPSPSS